MFPRSSIRYALTFFVTGSLFGAGVSAFIAPTAEAQRVTPAAQAAVSGATITPWSVYLSKDAVDANGIEKDLDGNASALTTSPVWP